jgi:endonuclease/exonuclease/phosphatase family metal-dependent hydrolase
VRDKSPATVRVMTWNIHGAAGGNPRFDLAGVLELIQRWDADIIALQEVDSRRVDARRERIRDDPFEVLLDALGKHGMCAKSITTSDGDYGQMLISRWPITHSEVHDISFPEREPRRAVRADIATPQGPIRIIATHLGLSIGERRGQAKSLLAMTGAPTMTTLVVGDFNDWFWPGSVRAALSRELPGYTRYRTFPSRCPLLRLDRIYCRPGNALIRSYIDGQARLCSDHLPIIADVAAQEPASVLVPRRSDMERKPVLDEV